MTKHLWIYIAIIFFCPMNLFSQNFDSLWKEYEDAVDKDLPKTEQTVLNEIIKTAEKKKAYGHLLKAELQRIEAITDVTPDSLSAEVNRLVEKEKSIRTKKPLLAAVYQSVLGMVYKNNHTLDENHEQISREYFNLSLSDPDLLAAQKAPELTPLVHVEADSKYFDNDLLSVLAFEAGEYELLYNYYEGKNRREAACMAAAVMLRHERENYSGKMANSKFLGRVDEMIERYGDLAVAGELALVKYDFLNDAPDCPVKQQVAFVDQAIAKWGAWPRIKELVNAKNRLIQPSFSVNFGPEAVLPMKTRTIKLYSLRNIKSLTMDVARVDLQPNVEYNLRDKNTYNKVKKAIVEGTQLSVTARLEPHADYELFEDTISLPPLPYGIYLAEFKSDVEDMKVERELFYVTDAFLLVEPQPDGSTRFAAVSATTGKPLADAKLQVSRYNRNERDTVFNLGVKGEIITKALERGYGTKYYLYTPEDKYCQSQSMWRSNYQYSPVTDRTSTQLFTDRAIYRPGQTVHVALLHFKVEKGINAGAIANKKLIVRLLDANRKEVQKCDVTTDEYGKAATEFQLPTAGLTGRFTITTMYGDTSIRVEEYKRPTFEVEIHDVKEEYKNGDTITVKGVARTYSGVPVQGANVAYNVMRRQASWWWGYRGHNDETLLVDSIVTDEKGEFEMRVPILLPENVDEDDSWRTWFYDIVAEATITDQGGESHTASISLPVSNKITAFNFTLPEKVERKSLRPVTFELKNAKGDKVEGEVVYYIDEENEPHHAKTNVPVELPTTGPLAKSGRHIIKAICNGDTVERKMILFSISDKKPCIDTHQWFYASHSEFPADGTPVDIQIGSSDPGTYVLYSVFSGNEVIEQGHFTLDNANQNRQWKYKDSYGDGILLTFAWVRDGQEYTREYTIRRPMPDKRIILKWETFRDRLLPGAEETWTLKATYPNGKPADAQMMATIYDKSLDQIYDHGWSLSKMIGVSLPYGRWHAFSFSNLSFSGSLPIRYAHVPELEFTDFVEDITEFYNPRMYLLGGAAGGSMRRLSKSAMMDLAAPMEMREASVSLNEEAPMMANASVETESVKFSMEDSDESIEESSGEMDVQLRENLNETAAFLPQVMADEQGHITLKFTLPEAVTTWKVMGIATDKTINSGYISGEAVAQKDIMVVPNVPRFVRVGDKAQLSARIYNTTERPIAGKTRMTLTDPDSETVVFEQTLDFSTEPNGTAGVTFSFDAEGTPRLLVCKVMATGDGFSDGEQHFLPLLPETEMITRTKPFTQNKAGVMGIDLSKLFPEGSTDGRLTLEYTNNPAWLMIQALPTMAPGDSDNAITQAMSYYANSLGQYIMNLSPNIKQTVMKWREETSEQGSLASNLAKNEELKDLLLNETPWVNHADKEESQKRSLVKFFDEQTISIRLSSAINKLKELQNGDGSWSWWKGMDGSIYMTTAVSEMLVRLNALIGVQDNTKNMLDGAFDFMGTKLIEEMNYAKKYKWDMPSETAMCILYNFSLDGRAPEGDVKEAAEFMVKLFEKKSKSLTIFGKARGAVILANFGRDARAMEYLQSIDEHAVVTEEMGRYFDTRQAYYSWCSYNIPTEVAAIEAYKMLRPEDKNIVDEMRIWLLQQKRTQMWNTPINSVDAVYAFLNDNVKVLDQREMSNITIDGKQVDTSEATAGLGYVKAVEKYDGQKMLQVEKNTEGTSWGAVYAQFMQNVREVEDASAGISVTREIRNGNKPLKVGDKVTMRITVKTERDLDFVEIIDRRAACMEPVNQLSGYHFGYYIAPKDYTTAYYFNHMAKGTYVIENEYYIDRKGLYETGTCKVQCAYAPEFCATGKALSIEVKE